MVTLREGRVSRNTRWGLPANMTNVTLREGRVSRNGDIKKFKVGFVCHAPRGACE